jgi:hypothetical protein
MLAAGQFRCRLFKLLLNNDRSGKPEDIYVSTGKRLRAAFGTSTGDRQMLEYTLRQPAALPPDTKVFRGSL